MKYILVFACSLFSCLNTQGADSPTQYVPSPIGTPRATPTQYIPSPIGTPRATPTQYILSPITQCISPSPIGTPRTSPTKFTSSPVPRKGVAGVTPVLKPYHDHVSIVDMPLPQEMREHYQADKISISFSLSKTWIDGKGITILEELLHHTHSFFATHKQKLATVWMLPLLYYSDFQTFRLPFDAHACQTQFYIPLWVIAYQYQDEIYPVYKLKYSTANSLSHLGNRRLAPADEQRGYCTCRISQDNEWNPHDVLRYFEYFSRLPNEKRYPTTQAALQGNFSYFCKHDE